MAKNYFLDTSVIIHSPSSILSFEDNNVYIVSGVLDDLKKLREKPGEIGHNAREALHILSTLKVEFSKYFDMHLKTKDGGTIIVLPDYDNIISASDKYSGIVVTLDDYVRVKCISYHIPVETYKTDSTPREVQYSGRCHLYLPKEEFDRFAGEKPCEAITDDASASVTVSIDCEAENIPAPAPDKLHRYYSCNNHTPLDNYQLSENEFITLHDISNPERTNYGRFEHGKIVHLRYYTPRRGMEVFGIHPKNDGQIFALEALLAPADIAPLVILKGPAGTAKTFLAMAAALEQTVNRDTYEGIIVSRPNIQFDEGIGFLPGDERQKVAPLNRPISDNISNLSSNRTARRILSKKEKKDGVELPDMETALTESNVISTESLSYMRGRSIRNKFIFIDEAQNATRSQIVGLITRPGEHTKIVLVGDPDQIDNKYLDHTNNGLVLASEIMRGSNLCWQLTFTEEECVRSKLAVEAVKRFHPDSTAK